MNYGEFNFLYIFNPILERFFHQNGPGDPYFLAFLVGMTALFAGLAYLAGRRALMRLLPRLLILASLVLVPLIFYRFNWQSYLPPKILVLHFATALLFAIYLLSGQWRKPIRNPVLLPIAVLFLTWTFSSLRAANMAESVTLLMNYVVYFTFLFMCFHYARGIHFLRLCINVSCATQIAMSIFGMMQIAQKIPVDDVFTHDQAVSTIGNVNFCSYYLDVVLPIAAAMLIYNLMRFRRTWLFAVIAALEVVVFNWTMYRMDSFIQFIVITLFFYLLLSAMEWIIFAMSAWGSSLSLAAFLTTKLYTYSLLLGLLHLFVIDSRGSHIGVLTCLIAMISSWAYFQGAFDLTRLFQRKEGFSDTPADRSFNRNVTYALLALMVGGSLVSVLVIGGARFLDGKIGGQWLQKSEVRFMPEWFGWFSPTLLYLFAFGMLLAVVLVAWALITWVYKQPGYAIVGSANNGEAGPSVERTQADKNVATAWAVMFVLSLVVGAGLIYFTYQGNARVSELYMEQGYQLGQTTASGEVVALPKWLDFWASLDDMGRHLPLFIASLLLAAVAGILFLAALLPVSYTPENLFRTTVLLLLSGLLAAFATLLAPIAVAYRAAILVLLASFYLILYNAVRHVSLRRVDQSSTSHWLGMTALNTLLPLILLVTAMGFHSPTIVKIWRGRLKDFSSTDLNTILFRFEIWKKSSRMIFDCDSAGITDFSNNNFLFGIGAGNFKVIELWFTSLNENRVLGKEVLARDPHSYYFLVATEAGVIGVVAMFWFFLLVGRTMIQFLSWSSRQVQRTRLAPEHKRMPRVIHQYSLLFYMMWGFFGAFMATVSHCAFEFNWTQPASAALIYFVVAAAMGLSQASARKEREAVIFESPRQKYLKESPYTDAEQAETALDERDDPVEAFTRRLSPAGAVMSVAALLLVVAVFHTGARHFMGENYLKWGMIFEEQDADRNPSDGLMLRYYTEMYRAFDRAYTLWPQQMETFYILGRYHIDIAHDIEGMLRIADPAERQRRIAAARSCGLIVSEEEMRRCLLNGARTHFVDLYMNPNYKWAHNNQGVTMDMIGRSDGDPNGMPSQVAREAYWKALMIDTEQIYALFNLGLGYMRQGQTTMNPVYWDQAIELLERASLVDPSKPETFNELARAYANKGDSQKAQDTLLRWGAWAREKVKSRPREVLVSTNLDIILKCAQLAVMVHRYPEAAEYLDMADKISPGNPLVSELRAETYYMLGNYAKASGLMSDAIAKNPSGDLYYRLATCQVKLEKFWDASLSLKRAFSMKPILKQQFLVDPNFEAARGRSEFQELIH